MGAVDGGGEVVGDDAVGVGRQAGEEGGAGGAAHGAGGVGFVEAETAGGKAVEVGRAEGGVAGVAADKGRTLGVDEKEDGLAEHELGRKKRPMSNGEGGGAPQAGSGNVYAGIAAVRAAMAQR